MAYSERHQEAVWAPAILLEAIWEPDRNGKYPDGSPEYWYFYNIFEYLNPTLLMNFEREVDRANNEKPKPSGFLKWQNVWREISVSYTDSIEKVFALLYNRLSADRWIPATKEIMDDRKRDLDKHRNHPDRAFENHKKIYKWWVCIYALLQILSKFGADALTKDSISTEARQELRKYQDYDRRPLTEQDPVISRFRQRL